jgi:hypothetical protein
VWRFQPQWLQWVTKNARDLSRLSAPSHPHELSRIDRRAISRCFAMIRQAFEPVPLPSTLQQSNHNHNMEKYVSPASEAAKQRSEREKDVNKAAHQGSLSFLRLERAGVAGRPNSLLLLCERSEQE